MKYLKHFLFLFFFIVILIRSSVLWLPWVWPLPSRAKPLGPHRFPPNLQLELPALVSDPRLGQKAFLYTDSLGALVHSHQKPSRYLIIGSHRTSSLFTKPEARWTSLISVPNLNFSNPNLYLDEIPDLVSQLVGARNLSLTHLAIVPDTGIRHADFRPDPWSLQPFRIWNEELTAHPLYEFLFLMRAKWIDFPQSASTGNFENASSQTETKSLEEVTKKDIPNFEKALERLNTQLNEKSIQLEIWLLPLEPEANQRRKAMRNALLTNLPEKGIKVFDISPCWKEAKADDSYFIGSWGFTTQGHALIASCLNKHLSTK
ncbi:hypothetical protein EBT16_06325 [bacterium]|nr:hypothetical protein [bacterium]